MFLTDLPKDTKNRLLEEEGQMAAADSLQRATDEAKNALEEYVYSLRSKVQGECAPFVKEPDGAALVSELNELENWLYEDGEDEKKSVRSALSVRAESAAALDFGARASIFHAWWLSNTCRQSTLWNQAQRFCCHACRCMRASTSI